MNEEGVGVNVVFDEVFLGCVEGVDGAGGDGGDEVGPDVLDGAAEEEQELSKLSRAGGDV